MTLTIDDNLHLTEYLPEDAAQLTDLVERNREYLGQRLTWIPKVHGLADFQAFIDRSIQVRTTNGAPTFGIWHYDELIGTISLHPINHEHKSALLGYWIAEAHQGHGIVSQALERLIRFAFDELDLIELELVCSTNNFKSQAIARKFGFVQRTGTKIAIWKNDPEAKMLVFALAK